MAQRRSSVVVVVLKPARCWGEAMAQGGESTCTGLQRESEQRLRRGGTSCQAAEESQQSLENRAAESPAAGG